jgi:hypothetical protein
VLGLSTGVEEEVPKQAIRHVDTLITGIRYCSYCYCIMRRNISQHYQPPQSLGLWRPNQRQGDWLSMYAAWDDCGLF